MNLIWGLRLGGEILIAIGVAYFASYFAYAWPQTPMRCVLGTVLGIACCVAGYRMAGGSWLGSTWPIHRGVAFAGLFFLGLTWKAHSARLLPVDWTMVALAIVAFGSYWVRSRIPKRRIKEPTS